jgi:hypothetical protein
MKRLIVVSFLVSGLNFAALAGETSLTVYNQNFAIVRETMKLQLRPGVTEIRHGPVANYAEPNSVILRDVSGQNAFSVVEQKFVNAGLSEDGMLSAFEGQTIDFVRQENGKREVVSGKIVSAGQPKVSGAEERYVPPVIEIAGKRQYELPGKPQFPVSAKATEFQPQFIWKVSAKTTGETTAEVAYSTYAITWYADYNVIAAESGNELQLTGWITLENKTGTDFENARMKFVAGNVGKASPRAGALVPYVETNRTIVTGSNIPGPRAKELEAFFLYDYPQPVSIRNNEQKQLEFMRAEGIQSKLVYSYFGSNDSPSYTSGPSLEPEQGVDSFTTISVVREFQNTEANHLGTALAQGRMRFFRRGTDKQLEFIGELDVPITAKDEKVEAILGDAASLKAERTRTEFNVDHDQRSARESFTIKLRNHKSEPVDIRVVERLFRWSNWEITEKSDPFVKKNANTIEFTVPVKPNEERVVSYTVVYSKLPPPSR